MNALIPPHGELALFLQKHILFVSKRAQGHMMDGELEGSCGNLVRSNPPRVYSQKAEGTPSFLLWSCLFGKEDIPVGLMSLHV